MRILRSKKLGSKKTYNLKRKGCKVKKTLLLAAALCLCISMTAFSAEEEMGVKGKKLVSGYLGYTLGFGDAFSDYEEVVGTETYKYSFDAGLNLGGAFHIGVTEKMLIGGELGFQSYKFESTVGSFSVSSSDMETNILASALYVLNYEEEKKMFLNFGTGIYGGGDSNLGLFGGIVYHKAMSSYDLILMPRLHYVLADGSKPLMLSLSIEASFPVGQN
ncbi:MAG: hypothetical protein DWP97_03065 [Calditrichaeota bacterium]|nr:MAG: hypothetical protein DWP97_03065 [Calditrichota bacterium]